MPTSVTPRCEAHVTRLPEYLDLRLPRLVDIDVDVDVVTASGDGFGGNHLRGSARCALGE